MGISDVFDFLTNGDQWHGKEGIPASDATPAAHRRVGAVAALIALPIGVVLGHVRTGGVIAVNIANIGRALPALALLILAVQWVGIGDPTGILTPVQSIPAFIAMVALARHRCWRTRTWAWPASTTRSAKSAAAWA